MAELVKLLPELDSKGDGAGFGRAVALYSDTLVVGAVDDDNGVSAGAAYIFERNIDGTDVWGPLLKLTAADGASGDSFGISAYRGTTSVAISVDTIAVGARYADTANGENSGAVYLFERNQGGDNVWGQTHKLIAEDGVSPDSSFGFSVSLDDDTLVVGTPLDPTNGKGSGAAYVFDRDEGGASNWGQVAKLLPGDGADYDFFGGSVALSVDTVAVGARGLDTEVGAVYLFDRDEGGVGTWGQTKNLTVDPEISAGFSFGYCVSLSVDTLAVVGKYGDQDKAGSGELGYGDAYVYGRDEGGANNWGQIVVLQTPSNVAADVLGYSISIRGDVIAVGAVGRKSSDSLLGVEGSTTGLRNTYAFYMYERDEGGANNWGFKAKWAAVWGKPNDFLGSAVAVHGGRVAVGASGDATNGVGSGAVHLHAELRGGISWAFVVRKTVEDAVTARGDVFGHSVSVDLDTAVVGSSQDDSAADTAGAAYVYGRDEGGPDTWGQVAKLVAGDPEVGIELGTSVSLDGDTLVVGAPKGFGESGAAYVYGRDEGGPDTWGQVAKLVAGDGEAYDFFGGSVSISGNTVVVGSSGTKGLNGAWSGVAYVFKRDEGGPDAWGQVAKLMASDGVEGDAFGTSVSLSGGTLAVGARQDGGAVGGPGAVYIFQRNLNGSEAWGQRAKIEAEDPLAYALFGCSVSLAADTLLIGAHGMPSGDLPASGVAYVFGRDEGGTNAWGQVAKLGASEKVAQGRFGYAVSLDGDTAAVGAYRDRHLRVLYGAVYKFSRDEGGADAWGQVDKLVASDKKERDAFGCSVSINGTNLVVGARGSDDVGWDAGSAYIF